MPFRVQVKSNLQRPNNRRMKVENLIIRNFKGIASENVALNGNSVYVIGSNGQCKSSFIDAVFKIITGKDLPSKVVKEGEQRGSVEINLGTHIVKAIFSAKDEKVSLSVQSPEGALYSSPRKMLDEMIGVIDFSITDFFNLSPKKQVDFIKGILGIDFTDLDDEYKKHFDERTFVNRKVKELEAQQVPFDGKALKEIDVKELQDKLSTSREYNIKTEGVKLRLTERNAEILTAQLALDKLKNDQNLATEWLKGRKEVNTESLQVAFDQAIEHNKQVASNIKGKTLKEEFKSWTDKQEELNDNLKSIEETKLRVIKETKMSVPGLTFDDNQLYLNGLPFEKSQINTAQQIITGLQINLALLKEVKIARFDGSLIDNENMGVVEKWAKENGLQLFVEFVSRDKEGLRIEIQEGK